MPNASSSGTFSFHLHFDERLLDIPDKFKDAREGYLNLANNELVYPLYEELRDGVWDAIENRHLQSYPYFYELYPDLEKFFGLPAERILMVPGTDLAIKTLTEIISVSTRRLLLQSPNYEGYHYYSRLAGLTVIPLSFRADGSYLYDAAAILDRVAAEAPGCLVLANPHPFTGQCLPLDEIASIARECRRRSHLFVVDEAYVPYNGFSHHQLTDEFDNLVVFRSFSKSFGVAGLRFGVMIAAAPLCHYLKKWRTAFPVSWPTVRAVKFLLSKYGKLSKIHQEIRANRDEAARILRELFPQYRVIDSHANFVAVDAFSVDEARRVCDFLKRDGILIRHMAIAPGMETCFRFTVGDRHIMDRLMGVFRRLAGSQG